MGISKVSGHDAAEEVKEELKASSKGRSDRTTAATGNEEL
jgi:hypothetical protein